MSGATTSTIMLTGTPTELGMQQLEPDEFDAFCCNLLSATAAIIARRIGVDRAAMLTGALANVAAAEADAHEVKEPLQ